MQKITDLGAGSWVVEHARGLFTHVIWIREFTLAGQAKQFGIRERIPQPEGKSRGHLDTPRS